LGSFDDVTLVTFKRGEGGDSLGAYVLKTHAFAISAEAEEEEAPEMSQPSGACPPL
jgi:hypothetical protein